MIGEKKNFLIKHQTKDQETERVIEIQTHF